MIKDTHGWLTGEFLHRFKERCPNGLLMGGYRDSGIARGSRRTARLKASFIEHEGAGDD